MKFNEDDILAMSERELRDLSDLPNKQRMLGESYQIKQTDHVGKKVYIGEKGSFPTDLAVVVRSDMYPNFTYNDGSDLDIIFFKNSDGDIVTPLTHDWEIA